MERTSSEPIGNPDAIDEGVKVEIPIDFMTVDLEGKSQQELEALKERALKLLDTEGIRGDHASALNDFLEDVETEEFRIKGREVVVNETSQAETPRPVHKTSVRFEQAGVEELLDTSMIGMSEQELKTYLAEVETNLRYPKLNEHEGLREALEARKADVENLRATYTSGKKEEESNKEESVVPAEKSEVTPVEELAALAENPEGESLSLEAQTEKAQEVAVDLITPPNATSEEKKGIIEFIKRDWERTGKTKIMGVSVPNILIGMGTGAVASMAVKASIRATLGVSGGIGVGAAAGAIVGGGKTVYLEKRRINQEKNALLDRKIEEQIANLDIEKLKTLKGKERLNAYIEAMSNGDLEKTKKELEEFAQIKINWKRVRNSALFGALAGAAGAAVAGWLSGHFSSPVDSSNHIASPHHASLDANQTAIAHHQTVLATAAEAKAAAAAKLAEVQTSPIIPESVPENIEGLQGGDIASAKAETMADAARIKAEAFTQAKLSAIESELANKHLEIASTPSSEFTPNEQVYVDAMDPDHTTVGELMNKIPDASAGRPEVLAALEMAKLNPTGPEWDMAIKDFAVERFGDHAQNISIDHAPEVHHIPTHLAPSAGEHLHHVGHLDAKVTPSPEAPHTESTLDIKQPLPSKPLTFWDKLVNKGKLSEMTGRPLTDMEVSHEAVTKSAGEGSMMNWLMGGAAVTAGAGLGAYGLYKTYSSIEKLRDNADQTKTKDQEKKEDKETKLESKEAMQHIISTDEIKSIIGSLLEGQAKIKRFQIYPKGTGLNLLAELDAGFTGGKIKIDAQIENSKDSMVIKNLNLDARGYVKSRIENKISEFGPAIKKYFETKYKRPVSNIQIKGKEIIINTPTIS